tara:strand:- start:3793 stop:5043 length:1251 start_codon:yes stop_codon:yes gene_type:complete
MKHLIHFSAFLFFSLGSLTAQQGEISIHEEQSKYYQNKATPLVEKISVLTGLDILLRDHMELIEGKSIALVTNQTGIDHDGVPNYKRLMAIEKVNLQVIFSPEHGLFGEAAAGQKVSYNLNEFNLPKVVSLYGKTRKPTPEMLDGIQLIIYDIQDIGSRFYTYITTLGLIMEAAGEQNIPVLVLDRPNPIRGDIIAGPLLDMNYKTFVGYYPIPIRYGGTIGDMAKNIIANKWISSNPALTVIATKGWKNNVWFDETDLKWVNPSPNIPDLETALVYPGMCLIEGTNVSEGRGTPHPFKWVGAPWIHGRKLSQELNKLELPGVVFVPVSFTPVSLPGKAIRPKHEGQECNGVEIRITNRNIYKSVETGVHMLFIIYKYYSEQLIFREKHLNRLWGKNDLLNSIISGGEAQDFIKKI